jgi:hypothetical protein
VAGAPASAPGPTEASRPEPPPEVPAGAAATGPSASTAAAGDASGLPTPGELVPAWDAQILSQLAIPVRSKWRGGRWIDPSGETARFAVPNEWHQKACEETRRDVEEALAAHFGRRVPVAVVVEGDGSGPSHPGRSGVMTAPGPVDPGPAGDDEHEHIDPSELRDAGDVTTGGVDLLMREFGGQLVEEER